MESLRRLRLYARAALAARSLNLDGLPILPKAVLGGRAPYNRGSYNEFVTWIHQLQLPSSTACIFDVGANHGDFSRAASACVGSAHVWLFEPLPMLWPLLERQVRERAGRWSVQPFALGAAPGTLALQVAAGDDSIGSFVGFGAAYQGANPTGAAANSIESRIETIDAFCRAQGIERIDLMKIDVEGFEFDVMEGARQMLTRTTALIVEVSLIRHGGGDLAPLLRMLELLERSGLHLVDLIPSYFSRAEPWRPVEYNILARRADA